MAKRTCSVDGCGSASRARGWCTQHYQRWQKHGDPLTVVKPRGQQCLIEGCDKRRFGHGWCQAHYTRWRKHGDPLDSVAVVPKGEPRYFGCTVERCEEPYKGRGFCAVHYSHAYRQENAETVRAAGAAYRAANREAISARASTWHKANTEKRNRRLRQQYKENPTRFREACNRRRALRSGAEVSDLTAAQWEEIKALYGQRCAYCRTKPKRLTQDHVIPLSKGGNHTASNVVPACLTCNCRKGAREAPPYQPILL